MSSLGELLPLFYCRLASSGSGGVSSEILQVGLELDWSLAADYNLTKLDTSKDHWKGEENERGAGDGGAGKRG